MSKVKAGDVLSCEVCGLAVIVDEECGCATIDLICCEEPMVNTGVSKIRQIQAAAPKKKAVVKKVKAAPKKKAAAKKKIVKKTAKKPVKKVVKKAVKKAAKKK
jgi:hypothetical protein